MLKAIRIVEILELLPSLQNTLLSVSVGFADRHISIYGELTPLGNEMQSSTVLIVKSQWRQCKNTLSSESETQKIPLSPSLFPLPFGTVTKYQTRKQT